MADEEKAKELTTELICGKCTEIKHCKIIGTDKCVTYIRSLNAISQGYNKGYEDGKLKWHNLRKNPDDLPKSKTSTEIPVLLVYKSAIDGEIVVEEHIYIDYEGFIGLESYYQGDYREPPYFKKEGVLIAWCELPKFEE